MAAGPSSTWRLTLSSHAAGVDLRDGLRVGYDVEGGEARAAPARIAGRALVWELTRRRDAGAALLTVPVDLDPATRWLVRCDRVDFPPGGVAYRHTHPGPGIRCLLHGRIRIETGGRTAEYGPGDAWFERGPEPVYAEASPDDDTAFVRALLLPEEWRGRRTIRYVEAADADRPKLQRATILLEEPLDLP